MVDDTLQRREFLYGATTAGIVGLAGCSSSTGDTSNSPGGGSGGGSGDQSGTGDSGGGELSLRIGTSAGGTKNVGLAVERTVSQHSDKLDYATVESPGYVGTIYRMAQDQFSGGITDNNSLTKALTDSGSFSDKSVDEIPYYGFYAFPYSIYLIARDGTDIETFDDLAGKNVYPAEPGYSTRATTLDVWSQDPTKEIYEQMNIQNMGVGDAPGAMEEGRIDAAIAYGTPGAGYTGWVTEYDARLDVHYVEPTDALKESVATYSGAGSSTISMSDWSMQQDIGTDEVFTWDLEVNYTFTPEANADAVYELCRVVDEHNDVVNEAEAQFNDFESTADMLGSAREKIPVHPGAAKYYKENEAWDESLSVGE
ncbi:TAXI family TRAP transporter solute-binding subunit [Halogeometricum borinquense]|uniref:TAXI family TRAP transporter solute-binding subunit n=1 Tax=Halogeometricum borinquense TaxID=60847 RepID=A0A482SXL8_9EURY|nr:TAXI family TRAP transporter solute-binding subunit [Halogeometricum borinquense]RYJ08228.1 TAXI family TRAP transporter solute-binding subunit [Halogeometricum borinquense]